MKQNEGTKEIRAIEVNAAYYSPPFNLFPLDGMLNYKMKTSIGLITLQLKFALLRRKTSYWSCDLSKPDKINIALLFLCKNSLNEVKPFAKSYCNSSYARNDIGKATYQEIGKSSA